MGRELLALLAGDARYAHVMSLGRREAASHNKVENRIIAFEDLDGTALPDVDDAFCCLGTTRKKAGSDEAFRKVDLDYVLAFARAAKRAGARRFLLVSALGADERSRLLYTRVKGQAETAVNARGFHLVGIARPSFLLGHRDNPRPGEAAVLAMGRALAPLLLGPLQRYRPISARAVAAGLVHMAMTAPDGVTVMSSEELAATADEGA